MNIDKKTAKIISLMALIGAVASNSVTFMLVQDKLCKADRDASLGKDELTKRNGRSAKRQWTLVAVFQWIGEFCIDSIAGYYFWKHWILK